MPPSILITNGDEDDTPSIFERAMLASLAGLRANPNLAARDDDGDLNLMGSEDIISIAKADAMAMVLALGVTEDGADS